MKFSLENDVKELGPFSKGEWVASNGGERYRISKCLNTRLFGLHYDASFIKNKDERTFFTFMVYLNDTFEGGETVFYQNEKAEEISWKLKPKQGILIFFIQDIYHEGRPVIGEKYIFRSDIIYKRAHDENSEELSTEKLSLKYFEMAQELERSKQGKEAVEYYKKAFKLNPDLEKSH